MLDPQRLRHDIDHTARELLRRGYQLDVPRLQAIEAARRETQQAVEGLQSSRNAGAKAIGIAKSKGEPTEDMMAEMELVNQSLQEKEAALKNIQQEWHEIVAVIPNVLSQDVPDGISEDDNVELTRWGTLPTFSFEPKDHVAIGEFLNGLSGSAGARLTGARFSVLQGDVAKLHRALAQFMLNTQVSHGYMEMNVPTIANSTSLFGTSNLPKFAEDLFKLEGFDWYLTPTAEVTLTNLVADRIVDEAALPLKFTAHTQCYRSEAGSHGKDTRGFIRQHQFEKVELVQIVTPETSEQAHEALVGHAERILQLLQLPYRKMVLCAGDTGFGAQKTYDLEVWLPGQNAYREISSCSNFGDFQARRMGARYRRPGVKKPELVHTLNGSGLAIGRTLVAVLENYQQVDGRVKVPEVLLEFMGKEYLEPAPWVL